MGEKVSEVRVQREQRKTVGWWPGRTSQKRWNLTPICICENLRSLFLPPCPKLQGVQAGAQEWKKQLLFWKLRGDTLSENFFLSYLFQCCLFEKGIDFPVPTAKKPKINQERNDKDGPGNEVKMSRLGEDTMKWFSPHSGCSTYRDGGPDCSNGSGDTFFSLTTLPTPLPTPFPPKAFCRWYLSVPRTSLEQWLKDQNSRNHFFLLVHLGKCLSYTETQWII